MKSPAPSTVAPTRMMPQRRKILESILLLIRAAKLRDRGLSPVDFHDIFFLADVDHLNRYGRPVIFDNYVAKDSGPVPEEVDAMLGEGYPWKENMGLKRAPFTHLPCFPDTVVCVKATRQPKYDVLSESDTDALFRAFEKVDRIAWRNPLWNERKEVTTHPAYLSALEPAAIDYCKMLTIDDPELIIQLTFASHHLA